MKHTLTRAIIGSTLITMASHTYANDASNAAVATTEITQQIEALKKEIEQGKQALEQNKTQIEDRTIKLEAVKRVIAEQKETIKALEIQVK